jgi:hypothetical protein
LFKRGTWQLDRYVHKAINAPIPTEIDLKEDTLFRDLVDLIKLTAKGDNKSLIVYGGPGIGKTYVVTTTLKELGMERDKDWFMVKGHATPIALYQNLFLHRRGQLLVFDDTDSIWEDKDAANIMKAALDSYSERTISWFSSRTTNISILSKEARIKYETDVEQAIIADPASTKIKLPSEFIYTGRVIFISNLIQKNFDKAVLSRSLKIDMTLTPDQLFRRLEAIIADVGPKNVSVEDKRMILNKLKEYQLLGNLKNPDMRTFVLAVEVFKSGAKNWVDLLRYG